MVAAMATARATEAAAEVTAEEARSKEVMAADSEVEVMGVDTAAATEELCVDEIPTVT